MSPLVIKCYLRGRRLQYALYAEDDMSVDFGRGADLCPRGLELDVGVSFRLVADQWFVAPRSGEVRLQDGTFLLVEWAIYPPILLVLGTATLIVDCKIDPGIPVHTVQGAAPADQQERGSAKNGTKRKPRAIPPPLPDHLASTCRYSLPGFASLLDETKKSEPKPVSGTTPVLSSSPPHDTQVLDMAKLFKPPTRQEPAPGSTIAAERSIKSKFQWRERLSMARVASYASIGVLILFVRLGSVKTPGASAAVPAARAAPAAPAAPAALELPGPPRAAPAPLDHQPSAARAGALYATGDYPQALLEYRALASLPGAEPVFGVVAHSLERRLAISRSKR